MKPALPLIPGPADERPRNRGAALPRDEGRRRRTGRRPHRSAPGGPAGRTRRLHREPTFLEFGLDPNAADGDGHAPLRYAARNAPYLDALAALVEGGAEVNHASRTGITALTAACRHADSLPSVRWLLEHGADPEYAGKEGETALDGARRRKADEIVALLEAR